MIRHLLKLFWIRRKANALLLIELVISTLVLFAVVYMAIGGLRRWTDPTGFDFRDRYVINLDIWRMEWAVENSRVELLNHAGRVLRELKAMPGVTAVGTMSPAVYSIAYSMTDFHWNNKTINSEISTVSDEIREVFDIEMIAGRWFNKSDEALDWTPVVLDERLAMDLFGEEDPLGKVVSEDDNLRVVGVCETFRVHGELSTMKQLAFLRQRLQPRDGEANPPTTLVIRAEPNSPATLEHALLRRAQSVAPDWSITIDTVENMRSSALRLGIIPVVLLGVVAAFLLIMVILGLLGVFWQAVTSRIEELGLRRSFGGTRSDILWQIIGEILVLTFIGEFIASFLIVQFPLLGIMGPKASGTMLLSLPVTLIIMILLTVISGVYPALLASRIEPAQAMRYE